MSTVTQRSTVDLGTILLHRNQVLLPTHSPSENHPPIEIARAKRRLGTLIGNFLYYGFTPSAALLTAMQEMALRDVAILDDWWLRLQHSLKAAKGDDKDIGKYVVYQNFPKEVLAMSKAEYWIRQICIYWAIPMIQWQEETAPEPIRQAKEPRAEIFEKTRLRVLHPVGEEAIQAAWDALLARPARWTEQEQAEADYWLRKAQPIRVDIPFKENLIYVALAHVRAGTSYPLDSTTDVLRLAAGLSGGDITLAEATKFRLSRPERRALLDLLTQVGDLEEGLMRYPKRWKRLFHQLHVGEYRKRYPTLYAAAAHLRQGLRFPTFNSQLEALLEARDTAALDLLSTRPGEFARRIRMLCERFGAAATDKFVQQLDQLETIKLLKLKGYLKTANSRHFRTFTPKGNWRKLQVALNEVRIDCGEAAQLIAAIDETLRQRITAKFGDRFRYSDDLQYVKFPSNDTEAVSRFTKGTTLFLPENTKFIRTATYWEERGRTCWMDNGWNFFDDRWRAKNTISWDNVKPHEDACVFSGDPVNSYDGEGKAAQMIDLYLDKLLDRGIRYGLWTILSYSHIPFDDVADVQGLMMFGENPQEGKLLEPSRVQFSFPVTGTSLTKYICYADFRLRRLVMLDTSMSGNVGSARLNEKKLSEQMPAVLEYLDALPSMLDLFEVFVNSTDEDAIPVCYSDKEVEIAGGRAYVFQPENEQNAFDASSIEDFLSA